MIWRGGLASSHSSRFQAPRENSHEGASAYRHRECDGRGKGEYARLYVFHNRSQSGAFYELVTKRLLPFDASWQ
jgi:hypothetical protein